MSSGYICLFSNDNNDRKCNNTESLVCGTRRESRYGWNPRQIWLTWQQKESDRSCHSTRLAGKLVADWREMRTQPTAAFFGFSHFSSDSSGGWGGGRQTFTPWHLAQGSNYYLNQRERWSSSVSFVAMFRFRTSGCWLVSISQACLMRWTLPANTQFHTSSL